MTRKYRFALGFVLAIVAFATLATIVPPSGGGAGAVWGAIAGTLSAQTDLQSALNAKGPAPSDTAYDATSWDGVTTIAPSKNTVRDKFVSVDAEVLSAQTVASAAAFVVARATFDFGGGSHAIATSEIASITDNGTGIEDVLFATGVGLPYEVNISTQNPALFTVTNKTGGGFTISAFSTVTGLAVNVTGIEISILRSAL